MSKAERPGKFIERPKTNNCVYRIHIAIDTQGDFKDDPEVDVNRRFKLPTG